MVPGDLRVESFAHYPPQARSFSVENLSVLKRMPLILLSVVLRQVIQVRLVFSRREGTATPRIRFVEADRGSIL
ncbi:hypothetical protein RBB78_09200 [Tunturiibacter empetritectus]|uniref:hypothetical protein n=1 Tax=Tunturiibacter empetritectus TaxID=3069691 RepID=UPI003D9B472C